MITNPKLSTVLKHTSILCKSLKQQGMIHNHESVSNIMQKILTFVANQCKRSICKPQNRCGHCEVIEEKLREGNVPLILVEFDNAYALVEAKQISRTVTRNLSPYLYQLPDKWGPFFWLFKILGATDKPSIAQYAFVLKKIFDIGDIGSRHPNVLRVADEAARGLFKEIHESDGLLVEEELANTSDLYLPSTEHGLKKSHTLFFHDADHLNDRIPKSELLILHTFRAQESIMKEVIDKLPLRFQPKALSGSIKEVLDLADIAQARCLLAQRGYCDLERRLEVVLHSTELFNAIVSIVKHHSNKDMSEKEKKSTTQKLSLLKLCCMQRVQTVLEVDGKNIAKSAERVPAFVRGTNQLYVTHTNEEMTLFSAAKCINRVLGNMVEGGGQATLLVALSVKSPSEILSVLSMDGIETSLGGHDGSDIRFPPPGSAVPSEIFHLIEQDMWVSFEEGEYVALLRMDRDREIHYIYAHIVRLVRGESIQRVYLVDIGSDSHIEASVFDIHKIHIPKERSTRQRRDSSKVKPDGSGISHQRKDSSFPSSIDEAKRLVTEQVKEVLKLPEEERKRAVHRLMLKWHPDKHPEGPDELFNEAFKHLNIELQRLSSKGISSYDNIFRQANQRASDDRQRFNTYGGYAGGSWRSGTESTNWQFFFERHFQSHDYRKARQWLRQAYEDLRAGRHDMDPTDSEPSFEWVSFKCHQAVEKGLKAVRLALRGYASYTHDIYSMACEIKDAIPNGSFICDRVIRLAALVDYAGTRYPDDCAFSQIPHECYNNRNNARTALKITQEILDMIASYVKRDS
ncbi:sacsin-like [Diadema antillarum]|uniref:sacsin-like n=1 Tax=Diadema antillarum TaxID=105358 RepID=UPI003A860548